MPSIIFMPLSVSSTVIQNRNVSILECTLRTGGGTHRSGEIPEYDHVLTNVKLTLRVGDTLVPSRFRSDRTHLSNYAGDKPVSLVCMTIRNPASKLRKIPTTHSIRRVALLPIPIPNRNMPQKRLHQ